MDQKQMYILARCWEIQNGEDFIEYFCDYWGVKKTEIMEWMNEKGYIDNEKLELFKNAKNVTMCDCLCGYENDFALFAYGAGDEDASYKSELIIMEYLLEKGLENKLLEFAYEGEDWASFDSEEQKNDYKDELNKYIKNWNDNDNDGFQRIKDLSIKEINDRLFKENK
jgi:hypothetical protein